MRPTILPLTAFAGRRRRIAQGLSLWLGIGLWGWGAAGAALDQVAERFIAPGTRHRVLQGAEGPWAIHVLELERGNPYVQPEAVLGGGRVIGLETVRAGADRLSTWEHYAVAGVNGDFFRIEAGPYQGDPIGLMVAHGELLSSPYPRSALVLTAEGSPIIDVFRLEASVRAPDGSTFPITGVNQERGPQDLILYTPRFHLATRTSGPGVQVVVGGLELPIRPNRGYLGQIQAVVQGEADVVIPEDGVVLSGSGKAAEFLGRLGRGENLAFRLDLQPSVGEILHAVGGGPRLVRAGKVSIEAEAEGFSQAFVTTAHPRTAVGFNERKLFLVTVDGRQPGYSVGMTLPQLAELMLSLGCREAMNLDGGGSTTCLVRGQVVNRPSDQRERPVANALLLFSTAPRGPLARLSMAPETVHLLVGGQVALTIRGEDEFYNPVEVSPEDLTWSMEPDLGMVDAAGVLRALRPGTAILQAAAGRATARVTVHIEERLARLEIQPSPVTVGRGGEQPLSLKAWAADGQPVLLDPAQVQWIVAPELGWVDSHQVFHAAPAARQGALSARVGGAEAQVLVQVGSRVRLIDDFEDDRPREFFSYPPGVPGSLTRVPAPRHSGQWALRLEYDFTTTEATRAAYARLNRDVGAPSAVRVWVYGDGNNNWLRGRFIDAKGQKVTVDFSFGLDFRNEWRQFRAAIPAGTAYPIRWESLYLAQPRAQVKNKGAVYFDGFEGEYPPEW